MSKDQFDDQVEAEFLEETSDTLNELDVLMGQLEGGQSDSDNALITLTVKINSLIALGRHSGQPLLNVTMQRLASYLDNLGAPNLEQVQDIQTFTDILRGIMEGTITHKGYDFSEFVRSLPVQRPADLDDIDHLDIEIMIIEPRRSVARLFERELMACGYLATWIKNPLDAIEAVIRTKPDMILSSMELDPLSGVDLACIFASMAKTRNIPFALLTSYERSDAKLKELPEKSAIIHKDKRFSDELADVLQSFSIA